MPGGVGSNYNNGKTRNEKYVFFIHNSKKINSRVIHLLISIGYIYKEPKKLHYK